MKYLYIFIVIVFANISFSSETRLKFNEVLLPFKLDFPAAPQVNTSQIQFDGHSCMQYHFFVNDDDIKYSATILETNLTSNNIKQQITDFLDKQIFSLDSIDENKSNVIKASDENFLGYPSLYKEVTRNMEVKLFFAYRIVYAKGYIVSIWAGGVDTPECQTQSVSFLNSLKIKK